MVDTIVINDSTDDIIVIDDNMDDIVVIDDDMDNRHELIKIELPDGTKVEADGTEGIIVAGGLVAAGLLYGAYKLFKKNKK